MSAGPFRDVVDVRRITGCEAIPGVGILCSGARWALRLSCGHTVTRPHRGQTAARCPECAECEGQGKLELG